MAFKDLFTSPSCEFTLHGEPQEVRALLTEVFGENGREQVAALKRRIYVRPPYPARSKYSVMFSVRVREGKGAVKVRLDLSTRTFFGTIPSWADAAFHSLLNDLHIKAVEHGMLRQAGKYKRRFDIDRPGSGVLDIFGQMGA